MHVCKGGWAGQAFALATNNDSGGKKTRIRRSKEERKSMVESFIKKYQKSNNGSFPTLNLTHKEVGGSFYTVREIVREIIQENRVLAPPKVSLEGDGHYDFLEQHPLGSISVEPQVDLSESERLHMVTHILPNKYQLLSEENISSSNGSRPLEVANELIINGVSKVSEKGEGSRLSESHHALDHYLDTSIEEVSKASEELPLPKTHEFEDEKIVNGSEVIDGIPQSDKTLVTNVDDQENVDGPLLPSGKINGLGSQRLIDEQYQNKNDLAVDKTEEVGGKTYTDSAGMETLDKEKVEAKNVVTSQVLKSEVVVEIFPLRPVPMTTHDMDGESGKLQETVGRSEDKAIQHEKKAFTQSPSGIVNENGEEKLPYLSVELIDEKRSLQGQSLGNQKSPSASENTLLVKELQSKVSLPDATKASSSTETLISEDSIEVGGKSTDQDDSSSSKGNNRTLDRINLETWEGASKESTQSESNPILALVKAFISSFVKFWTE